MLQLLRSAWGHFSPWAYVRYWSASAMPPGVEGEKGAKRPGCCAMELEAARCGRRPGTTSSCLWRRCHLIENGALCTKTQPAAQKLSSLNNILCKAAAGLEKNTFFSRLGMS